MFKYQGFDYSLEQVTEAADNLGLTVDEYVNKHGLETVEVTNEIQTTSTKGKTSDVATVDAAVTSEPDAASESTESDSVDTSGELQLFDNYKDAIKLTAEEQAVIDNPIDFTPSGVTRELQPYNPDTGENLIKTIFDERFQDPTTGEFVEEADLIYRSDVNEAGEPLPVFQPYSAELSDAKKYLVKQGVKDPTNQQVQDIAEKNIKAKFKYQKIKSKSDDYLNSIPDDERKKLIPYQVNEFINLDEKYKGLNNNYISIYNKYKDSPNAFNLKNISSKFENPDYNFDLKGLKSVKDADVYLKRLKDLGDSENLPTQASVDLYNNLLGKYKTAVESAETVMLNNGKEVPKATFNLYKELAEENQEVNQTLSMIGDEIEDLPTKLSDIETELGFLKQNYSTFKKAGANVALQMGKIPFQIAGGVSRLITDANEIILNKTLGLSPQEIKGVVTNNPLVPDLYAVADFAGEIVDRGNELYQQNYKDDVKFEEAFDDLGSFSEFALQEIAGQAGTFSMMASGMIPGAVGLGTSTYADQRQVLENEAEVLGTDESTHHKAAVALGYAAAEVGLGFLPSMKIFKRGFDAAEQLGKRNLVQEGLKNGIKKGITRTFVYDPLIESSTEGGTQLVQNLIDQARGKNVGTFENVGHAAFVGGMLGTTFSSIPAVKGIVLANLSDYNSYEGFRNNLSEITELNEIAETLPDKRTKEFKIIKDKISELNDANNDILIQTEQKVAANLTAEGFDLFSRATTEQEGLRIKADEIINSSDLNRRQKETILKAIKTDFDFYQQARDNFRKDYKVNIDLLPTKERERYIDMAKVELEKEGKEFTNAQLKQQAEKIWQVETFDKNAEQDVKANAAIRKTGVDETYVMAETKSEAIQSYTDALMARAADPNNSLTEEQAKKVIADFTRGVNAGTINGANYQTKNNKTGKAVYDKVVVRENAIANGKTSTGIHETGHTLFTEGLSSDPEAFDGLADTVLKHLKDTNQSAYNRIRQRTQGKTSDEVLTEFLEEVSSGRLDLEAAQNKKLLGFLSIGIPQAIKNVTNDKSNFNLRGEKDVVDFLTSLGTKLKEGSLTVEDVQAIQEGRPEAETVYEGRQALSEEASNKVQQIYEQKGEAGAFDIIEQFKPITSRIAERRREAPGFDRQLLMDEIETGQRGIIDLIKEYKPESGVPLAAYINKFLPARAIEASKRVLGEEFTEDVTEARGVAAEEVVTETAVKPEAKAIDPFRIMPDVKETATAEVQKSIADKDVDVTTVTYKELKDVAPYQTVADFFNIPVSRIKNPKDNLRKSDDVANIQRWILKNEPTLKNLFTEANRDVIEVTEGNRVIRQGGEPTAIPRNLLNKFYTKGDRVGNNFQWKLKPYDRATFLEAVGIKDGKVDPNFTPRAAEAQTIKGILDMYTRNLGNVAARDIIETRKDVVPAEKARAKAEVAKGKPKLMLSETQKNAFIYTPTAESDFAKDVKGYIDIVKAAGYNPIIMRTAEGRKRFLDDAVSSGLVTKLPKEFWLSLTGTTETALTKQTKKELKEAGIIGKPFTKDKASLREYTGNFPFLNTPEAETWIKEQEAKGVVFPESSTAVKATFKKFGYKAAKNNLAVKLNDPDFIEEQNQSLEGLKEIWLVFEQEMKNNPEISIPLIAAALSSTSAYQGTLMRRAAPVRFFEKGYRDNPFVEEHTLPASILAKYLLAEGINGNIEKVWPNVERNYQQGALLETSDKKLKGRSDIDEKRFDYTSVTPEGWNMTDNIWARYFNPNVAGNGFGINPNNIITEAGLSIFDLYGVTPSGGRVSQTFNLKQQNASKVNNNSVGKAGRLALSESSSMPDVLNNMAKLDEDAKQANKQFYSETDLNKQFNDILEVKTGIASEKRYKRVKAEVVGANKGRFQFFIPPSAEDFTGLLYSTLAKGKLGDAQMAWYKKNLLDPYGKAMNELSSARIAMMNDYKALKKELKLVPKDLRKKVPGEPFTQEQAVRVYIWQKQGMSVPGISEADMQDLSDFVEGKEDLKTFADQLMYIQKGDQYAGPKEGWPAGTITTDMLEGLNTIKRAKALEQWQANADEIFSEENLNKLEAAYGKPYRKAMENMLQRMKSGRNRNFQGDTLTGRVTDWLTGSIGTIMFFNTRSALLQTISSINFVNFTDNNILAAGKAFANQKQYWSDFMTLMNSDFLKERRGGLRINVNEADIADMAKRGGVRGVINKLLEFGFTPTQIADSFAIASGGATFYRNRIKSLKKQGMTDAEAEAQAFVDFRETAEESQQSSRPDRISMQQAGPLGRIVLAFANTPAQYARLIKKAASDLKNGRGDAKTNISKIIYYGVAQNLLFNALQQALFAFAFDDDEEDTDEQQKKYVSIANGMMDSLLRGMGIGGAALSVGKNSIKRIIDEMEKKQPKLEKVGYELTKLSPPISAKLSRVNQAARSYQWDKKEMIEKGWSLDNPAYLAGANVIAALTNIPLDRAVKKTNNVVQATSQDLETWERLALLGGWQDWEIGINEETKTNKPQPRKTKPRSRKTKKRKTTKR